MIWSAKIKGNIYALKPFNASCCLVFCDVGLYLQSLKFFTHKNILTVHRHRKIFLIPEGTKWHATKITRYVLILIYQIHDIIKKKWLPPMFYLLPQLPSLKTWSSIIWTISSDLEIYDTGTWTSGNSLKIKIKGSLHPK